MSKGFLLFDIGNTHTGYVFADADGVPQSAVVEIETVQWMQDPSLLPDIPAETAVWVACVVPDARKILSDCGRYEGLHFIDAAAGEAAGLDFSLIDVSTLGADRIANAAALLKLGGDAACFDCGTAITLEVVLRSGVFAGGAIAPGRKLMRRSLALYTAALPELPLDHPLPDKLGVNTLQALALGIDGGAARGMMRELIELARTAGAVRFIAAGGDGAFFCRHFSELEAVSREFTLGGIGFIAAQHR